MAARTSASRVALPASEVGAVRSRVSRVSRRPSSRGIRSRVSLSPKARRSASYWSGSSFDSPGLKASSEAPARLARASSFWSIVSDISSTGGGGFRPEA